MKCCCEATARRQLDCRAAFYFGDICEESITLSGWDLLIPFQYLTWRTLVGKRNVSCFLILVFISVCTRWSLEQSTMCFTLKLIPPPLVHLTTVILEQFLLPDVYISQDKVCKKKKKKKSKDKGKGFASTFLSVNAASPNLSMTTFHFCTFFLQGGGVLWQKYITAAALSRDWTTGIMCREVLSSCSGLFSFAFATLICSTHSDAMPSRNLLTSFSSQFDVYFPIHPLTNC